MKKHFLLLFIFLPTITVSNSGNLIFVRGIPSSGKTTLCKALQKEFSEPYLHFSIDIFDQMIPERYIFTNEGFYIEHKDDHYERKAFVTSGPLGLELTRAFADCIKGLVENGHNVIVEAVMWQQEWLDICKKSWEQFPCYIIKVLADLDLALARAILDKNMPINDLKASLIRGALEIIERVPMDYDLVLESGKLSVDQEVQAVVEYMHEHEATSL